MPRLVFRRAEPVDTQRCFRLFWASIGDLAVRMNVPWEHSADEAWPRLRDLYAFLADHAAEWWLAEGAGGALLGYARSIERGGLFELSEFFVDPAHQSAGIGRALLERAFPAGRGEVRAIIATSDMRAVARYHRAGTSIQFPFLRLGGTPAAAAAESIGLVPEQVTDAAGIDAVGAIERSVLGYDRRDEMDWLLEHREGFLYREPGAGHPIGFAFVGASGAGPIASLDPRHQPDILRHVEGRASALGRTDLGIDIPAPNVIAVRHLLDRGFRLGPSVNFLMASRPFGSFDRFIGYAPPFIL
jgi:GNAT superfamily N-acetyltransferase